MTKTKNAITSMGTVRTFFKVGTCSEALMNVLDRAFDQPLEIEEHGAIPLAGGIAQHGFQCGMLWGTSLAAGAQAYRLFGTGPQAETAAIIASQRALESFRHRYKYINCLEITDTDWTKKLQMLKNFLKGGPITCFRMSASYAPMAFNAINSALAQRPAHVPPCSASCAAKVARKMGLSEKHAVMAAGFAGGIGLSGGACGALGAAIWAIGMKCSQEGLEYKEVNARCGDTIDKFMKVTDYKFECSEIVGRKFEGVSDHSTHLQNGGCSKIIELLASLGEDGRYGERESLFGASDSRPPKMNVYHHEDTAQL